MNVDETIIALPNQFDVAAVVPVISRGYERTREATEIRVRLNLHRTERKNKATSAIVRNGYGTNRI